MKKLIKPSVEEINESKVEALIEACTCQARVCGCVGNECECVGRTKFSDVESDDILF